MELIILGSGTGIPLPYRASPSLILFIERNPVLFDMGPGTLRQIAKIGIQHDRIEQIFISHFHPDHTADLIHFLFVTRYFPKLEDRKPFIICGPLGLVDFLKKLQRVYGKWLDVPPEIMKVEELDLHKPEKRSYNHYHMISQHVRHTPHSLAYRIEGQNGKSFVYSGDTAFCNEIVALAKGCDLLVLECSSPENNPMDGHLTPSQAAQIACLSKPKKLVLTHLNPGVLATDIVENCRKTYSGELIIGKDLLHISV
jgi:ribonuclease BN (tRNA processing enzyme)